MYDKLQLGNLTEKLSSMMISEIDVDTVSSPGPLVEACVLMYCLFLFK